MGLAKDFNIEKLINKVKLNRSDFNYKAIESDLSNIVNWIEKIESVDVENIEPCSNLLAALEFQNAIPDEEKTENPEESMRNAKYQRDNYFIVPKVIK